MWDLFYEAPKVRTMLTRKIQEEALRTYLFTYSKVYDSISVVSEQWNASRLAPAHLFSCDLMMNPVLQCLPARPAARARDS